MERNFIKPWRKAQAWSQEALAEKVSAQVRSLPLPTELAQPPSWGRTDVNKYERGVRDPPLLFITAMASLIGCDPGDILNGPPRPWRVVRVPEQHVGAVEAFVEALERKVAG